MSSVHEMDVTVHRVTVSSLLVCVVCYVSGCVRARHYGLSAPAVAHYWGYLRSANAPLIVRSSKILCVPVLLLVLSPGVFRSPPWLRRILLLDLAAHCVPAPIFHPRFARALNLPATLFDLSINCCISAIESFSLIS